MMLRHWLRAVSFCAAACAMACGGDDDDSANTGGSDPCTKAGDVSEALNCQGMTSKQAVIDQCRQEQGASPANCKSQLDAANACAVQQPTSSFECSVANDGSNALKSGVCANEFAAYLTCYMGG